MDSSVAAGALEQLCRTYWYPLYAYVRRQGRDPHEAQDLTQEFFARLLAAKSLQLVDRSKGKFRSFLLASLNHFLAKEWNRAHRQKRGGGRVILSLDDDTAEQRYLREPADPMTADKLFERRWALTLLEGALSRLRQEFLDAGKESLFEELKFFISGGRTEEGYAGVTLRLNLTEGAVKVAVHRLRKRYGEILRAEIAQTVSSPEEVEEEIRYLFQILGK
ncbi:MAG: sigma-70 family RNA polymerase sigma factor [Verrucomicrobia bacterium]|nr:sigma-70 family RNA polymerase sigma factor [Verrucomicrobiota bacterium]